MDLSKLTPSDAAVTLRGLERRYRGLFGGLGEDESLDDLAQRASGGWSAIEHIVAAAWAIGATDRALRKVVTDDSPQVSPADIDPAARPKPGHPTSGPVHERLAELGLEAVNLAEQIERVSAADWTRQATVDDGSGRQINALDIVRSAVDAGITHLRDAERVLAAVRGHPDPTR